MLSRTKQNASVIKGKPTALSAATEQRKGFTYSLKVDVSVQTAVIQTAVPVFNQSSLSPLDFRCDPASLGLTLATLANVNDAGRSATKLTLPD